MELYLEVAMAENGQTIGTYYFQLAPSTKGISKSIDEAIGGAGSSIKSSFGSIMGVVAKGAAVAFGAAASGVGALAGAATSAYANFEQLEGGIATLFKDDAGKAMANAEKAFQSAGMSMNEYMETAIQSSAAMIASLEGDTNKAADLMDMSIIDMSDNVNKMGTTMEAVQNAYRGFSRGNFTMLDNLALGFAGTKQGMQELLDKAHEISGVEYDISSYADIVNAIHVIQTEMGITGTTSQEAADTISGSLNSVKAAWSNVLTGIADENADFDTMINNLVNTVSAFAGNMLPRIGTAIKGVGKLVASLAPILADAIPQLFKEVAPSLASSAMSLIENVVNSDMINALSEIVVTVLDGLSRAIPKAIPMIIESVLGIIEKILDNLPMILNSLLVLLESVNDFIVNEAVPHLLERLPSIIGEIVKFVISAIPQILTAIVRVNAAIMKATPSLIEGIVKMIPDIVVSLCEALVSAAPDLIVGFVELFSSFTVAIPLILVELAKVLPQLIFGLIEAFQSHAPELKAAFQNFIPELLSAFSQAENATLIQSAIGDFFAMIGSAIAEFFRPAIEVMLSIWDWFYSTFSPLINAFKELFTTIFTAIKIVAERIWSAMVGKLIEWWAPIWEKISPVLETIKSGIELAFNFVYDKIKVPLEKVKTFISDTFDKIREIFTGLVNAAKDWGKDLILNFMGGIQDKIGGLTDTIKGVSQKIKDFIGFSEPDVGPLSNFHTYAPDMMQLFAQGIKDSEDIVTDQLSESFDFRKSLDAESLTNDYSSRRVAPKNDDRLLNLLSEFLPYLAQKDRVEVNVNGNMPGIFDAMVQLNEEYKTRNGGESAYA